MSSSSGNETSGGGGQGGGLSFVATSIQTADKGGYHYEERSLQRPVEHAGGVGGSTLPRDLEKLQQRDSAGAAGFSRRREDEQTEDELNHEVDNAPKGLDPEEYEFLTTIQQAQKKRAKQAAEREAQDREQFMTAVASRTLKRNQYTPAEEEEDYSNLSFNEAEAARLQQEREERKKRLKEKMAQSQQRQQMLKNPQQTSLSGEKRHIPESPETSEQKQSSSKKEKRDAVKGEKPQNSAEEKDGNKEDEEPVGALVAYGDSDEDSNENSD